MVAPGRSCGSWPDREGPRRWSRKPRRRPGKVDTAYYEKELARLQVELVKQQECIRARGLRVVVIFEGRDAAGKGGAIKRITETLNPRAARVVALPAPTEREKGPVVLPALRRPPARRRRDGPVRPVLVQPRRRRAGHGLLHRRGVRGVPALLPGVRADAGAQRDHPDQVLVLGQRRRAGEALPGAAEGPDASAGSSARWTSRRATAGWSSPGRRTRCSPPPTSRRRRGGWSRPTTRSAPGST